MILVCQVHPNLSSTLVIKMRCIFCKEDSTNSKSVEHIIPESLGCKKHILPVGIVCDKCNNYFARKIEKPFMDEYSITHLRFAEGIENKKGTIPSISGILNYQHPVKLSKDIHSNFAGHVDVPSLALDSIISAEKSTIIFPMLTDNYFLKVGPIVSRFVGKIAIEAFAQRILESSYNDSLDLFIDDVQFDPLRNHVRRGIQKDWNCNVRRIYEVNKQWIDTETHERYQVINEYDFLYTDIMELYFILAIFGMEYTINLGGSCVEGYKNWLKTHHNESPLYNKNNSSNHHA